MKTKPYADVTVETVDNGFVVDGKAWSRKCRGEVSRKRFCPDIESTLDEIRRVLSDENYCTTSEKTKRPKSRRPND